MGSEKKLALYLSATPVLIPIPINSQTWVPSLINMDGAHYLFARRQLYVDAPNSHCSSLSHLKKKRTFEGDFS